MTVPGNSPKECPDKNNNPQNPCNYGTFAIITNYQNKKLTPNL